MVIDCPEGYLLGQTIVVANQILQFQLVSHQYVGNDNTI